jgi:hypothetical protein
VHVRFRKEESPGAMPPTNPWSNFFIASMIPLLPIAVSYSKWAIDTNTMEITGIDMSHIFKGKRGFATRLLEAPWAESWERARPDPNPIQSEV